MIPMLDDVSYHKLYLRINIEHLTEKEIEEEEKGKKRRIGSARDEVGPNEEKSADNEPKG